MTYGDHPPAVSRRPARHRRYWVRLGALAGFLLGLAVAVTPVFTHTDDLGLRVTWMVLGGLFWAVSAVVLMSTTGRSAR